MEIKRDRYLKKIISFMWDGQVKVITGIRRCGNSGTPASGVLPALASISIDNPSAHVYTMYKHREEKRE